MNERKGRGQTHNPRKGEVSSLGGKSRKWNLGEGEEDSSVRQKKGQKEPPVIKEGMGKKTITNPRELGRQGKKKNVQRNFDGRNTSDTEKEKYGSLYTGNGGNTT